MMENKVIFEKQKTFIPLRDNTVYLSFGKALPTDADLYQPHTSSAIAECVSTTLQKSENRNGRELGCRVDVVGFPNHVTETILSLRWQDSGGH